MLTTIVLSVTPQAVQANDVNFSIGGGYPFFVVPEISLASVDNQKRWYANYKIGFDDGFSIGFEQAISNTNKHALGFIAGAIGAREDKTPCPNTDNESNTASTPGDDFVEIIGSAIGCSLSKMFDEETTNGLALTYSYNFSGLNNAGMRIHVELGYGEGHHSKEKRADGGITLSYHF
ncbi:hypothetical protein [Paraglaciecola arctica]|uniref:hypothetical protein n=1 Tax=Paraglaciecola arctica TaxID=1128911 RepID=UPI001C067027|nr:hypothetical protein [Paraglaciecola arctica]MBU3003167.1 hypothetical protein [Paraglaciecola arctica]